MGKRIIQQRRGKGSPTYRVRRRAYRYRVGYPSAEGKASIIGLIKSGGHTAPLAKMKINDEIFYNVAADGLYEGQEIEVGGEEVKTGNILTLKNIPVGSEIYNIELIPGDGGKLIRSGGNKAVVTKKNKEKVAVLLPSKKEVWVDEKCRASIGITAGAGRLEKPIMQAGRKWYRMKARNKLYPRTSPIKMNVVDHPFGSGRGKNISHGGKGKTPKRNAPPGAKVGSLWPKRTGRRKK
ncbi:MAG: 50S ribosomal protein L2 [Nanoarchaeota archaeon]